MTPTISITLPSIYPDALRRALDNIEDATRNPYRVIVSSPFEPDRSAMRGGELVWLKEEKQTGCNAAHMAAVGHAGGEFVTAWVDDHLYMDGWDTSALANFEEREVDGPFILGLRHLNPTHVGTEFGIYYAYFPVMRVEHLDRIGWLTDEYRIGFADSDLCLRVWDAGGRCEWSAEHLVVVHPDDQRKGTRPDGVMYHQHDMDLFLSRWAEKWGAGWDTSTLRNFNIDLTPERFPDLVHASGRTFFRNDPSFKQIVGEGG